MVLLRNILIALLALCLGCYAQSLPSETVARVENVIRSHYNIPEGVKFKMSPLKPSEVVGYDSLKVTMDLGDKTVDYDFLLSNDRKTLVRWTKLDLSKDPYTEIMSKIDIAGRPVRGNKDAKVVVVSYDDFECPYCSRMHQTLFPTLLKEYGDKVSFVYKDYPLETIHPWAVHAAVDANCLAAQNGDAYWDFADYLHANQKEVNSDKDHDAALDRIALLQGQKHNLDAPKLQACIKTPDVAKIKSSEKEGDSVGVSATPTIFVNGREMDGALAIEQVREVLDAALKAAGVPPPVHVAESSPVGTIVSPPAAGAAHR